MRQPEIAGAGEKLRYMLLCYLLFAAIYGVSGWHAAQAGTTTTLLLKGDEYIPFLPWTILPYMSSGLLFIAMFFFCRTRKEVQLLSVRVLFITVLSGIVFFVFPLSYGTEKPEVHFSAWSRLFNLLALWDTPYNQLPSLHICYAFLMGDAIGTHLHKPGRTLLYIWLALMGISTLTTWQHHLADVLSAGILIICTYLLIPGKRHRNHTIGLLYLLTASVCCFIALSRNISSLWLFYPSINLALVGRAYYCSNPYFLRRNNGRISWLKRIVYFPFLLVYYLIWIFFRGKKHYAEIAPGIMYGARLTRKEAGQLLKQCPHLIVIDLSAELEDTSLFKNRENYYSFPLLDIAEYSDDTLKQIVEFIYGLRQKTGFSIYIHCQMGRWRSRIIGNLMQQRLKEGSESPSQKYQ